MSVTREEAVTSALEELDQNAWDSLVQELLPSIHPVDQTATRVWFSFWPLKLCNILHDPTLTAEMERDRELVGRFRLEEQLEESVDFFYGSQHWPEVANSVLAVASSWAPSERLDLRRAALDAAAIAAGKANVEPSVLLGITLAAFMALRQMGAAAFSAAVSKPRNKRSRGTPESVLRKRAESRGAGWLSFLKSVDRKHRVTFDENRKDGYFEAVHGQDLSMASATDKRNYQSQDPRRLEGPVPFECRSGTCGYCWVGVLAGAQNLAPISDYEKRRQRYFGYLSHEAPDEPHPPIRLACQSQCTGDVTLAVPPWNGTLKGRA